MTAEAPAAPRPDRPGAIVLARHGEPALSRKVRLSAQQYRDFWALYEVGGILTGQAPPQGLIAAVGSARTLVTSTRLRSIESAQLLAPGREFDRHEVLIEAPLPPPRWPGWIRLSPRIWGFLARFWWWFFNHHEGLETRAQAEVRAAAAADLLSGMVEQGQDVVVLAHGFFNFMIGRELRRRGWKQTVTEGYKYWSTRRFERV
ncbi:MAG TPA: histidine phosphatase family protein [Phenylobacterium sp.]